MSSEQTKSADQSVGKRLSWVDTAKAFSILLVVLAHTRIELAFIGVEADWADWLVEFFGTMRMPLFFAAAGIFATKWIRGPWQALFSGKIALLLWVFLIWQPVVFLYKVAEMLLLPNQPDNSLGGQVAKVILSPVRPNGELWFLWALCLFFIAAKALSRLPSWIQVGIPAVVSIAWFAIGERVVPESILRVMGDGWTGALRYYFFFAFAAVFSRQVIRWFSTVPAIAAGGVFVLWAATVAVISTFELEVPGLRFFVSCLAVAGGFGIARLLTWAKPLAYLGKNTLPVYVAHVAIIVFCVCLIDALGLAGVATIFAGTTVFVIFAVAIAAALTLHAGLERTRLGRYMYQQPPWFIPAPIEPKRRAPLS